MLKNRLNKFRCQSMWDFQTCQPLIKENLETHEEKSEILQKGVRFSFFQNKIKQTCFQWGS